MIERLSPVIKTKNGSRYPNTFDLTEKLNEVIDYLNGNHTESKQEQTFSLTETQIRKLICCLENTTYNSHQDKTRGKLIDLSYDLQWDLAEMLDIDLNEGCINIDTLEFDEF